MIIRCKTVKQQNGISLYQSYHQNTATVSSYEGFKYLLSQICLCLCRSIWYLFDLIIREPAMKVLITFCIRNWLCNRVKLCNLNCFHASSAHLPSPSRPFSFCSSAPHARLHPRNFSVSSHPPCPSLLSLSSPVLHGFPDCRFCCGGHVIIADLVHDRSRYLLKAV